MEPQHHLPRVTVVRRDGEQVGPLELFFDLVFVLAITQCSLLIAHDPTWGGIARGLVVLALLWWSWVGYAWLTSVIDPDEGSVRIAIFVAMAALLIAALAVPHAFSDEATTLAVAYGVVRGAHIALFVIASREDTGLRHSVLGLAVSTAVGIALLLIGSFPDGDARLAVWLVALLLDMGGPLVIDTSGWRLVPAHFAERHGLIVIVALGESIVAIGVGAESGLGGHVMVTAIAGIAIVSAFWWAYFDVTAIAAARRLSAVSDVTERNELARDAFSYLHLPIVAAVVLVALGLKTALAHVSEPLDWPTTMALAGGASLYVLGQTAFKARALGIVSVQRMATGAVLLALLPLVHDVDAIVAVLVVAAVLWAMICYELVRLAADRDDVRHAATHH